MVRDLPSDALLMPSPPQWIELAKTIHGSRLVEFDRYSLSSERLSPAHLKGLLGQSPFRNDIRRMETLLAAQSLNNPGSFVDLSAFDSAEDFAERGVGFCLLKDDTPIGAAFSSLVCSWGIEVGIFVEDRYRRRGVDGDGTATRRAGWRARKGEIPEGV